MSKNIAVVILDATGSMQGQEERVVTSMNEYVKGLPKKAVLSVFMFDSSRWIEFFNNKVKSWKKMTRKDYETGSMTPLFDSIAKGIKHAESIANKGDKVMIMIDTDGYENDSSEYNQEAITKLIEKKKKKGWDFLFMAAGVTADSARDVGAVGKNIGATVQSASHVNRLGSYKMSASQTSAYFKGEGTAEDIDIDQAA